MGLARLIYKRKATNDTHSTMIALYNWGLARLICKQQSDKRKGCYMFKLEQGSYMDSLESFSAWYENMDIGIGRHDMSFNTDDGHEVRLFTFDGLCATAIVNTAAKSVCIMCKAV